MDGKELRYAELIKWMVDFRGSILDGALYPKITEVVLAYIANKDRLHHLMALPFQVVGDAIDVERAIGIGRCKVLGYVEDKGEISPKLTGKVRIEAEQALLKMRTRTVEDPVGLAARAQAAAAADIRVGPGFGALYEALLISGWTVFETMAGDLWEQALNFHPTGLATLQGKAPRQWMKDEKKAKREKENASPIKGVGGSAEDESGTLIRLKFLEEHGYNVSNLMGTIWRRSKRFNFQTLSGIRLAYLSAFYEDAEHIQNAVLHPSLTALSEARNVLVHKAGMVDSDFLKGMKGNATFAGSELEEPLQLDGEKVRDVLDAAFTACNYLIEGVVAWIKGHPKKRIKKPLTFDGQGPFRLSGLTANVGEARRTSHTSRHPAELSEFAKAGDRRLHSAVADNIAGSRIWSFGDGMPRRHLSTPGHL